VSGVELKLAALELAERARLASRRLAKMTSQERAQLVLDAAQALEKS